MKNQTLQEDTPSVINEPPVLRMGSHPEVSFVVPSYNEEDNMAKIINELADEMKLLQRSYEIIIVDDGSADETVLRARAFTQTHPVRVVCLSRNFGKENAITAGLKSASGDAVIIIDADLQEPISYVKTFLDYWDQGYEMVYGVRAHRDDESWMKKLGTHFFYTILNKTTSVTIPPDSRDFRLMDRKVVAALCSLPESNRFMKGLYSWVGFKTKEIPIEIEVRSSGKSKFNYRNLFSLGFTGLTSFSVWPLRVWISIGTIVSISSIIYALWIIARTLIWGADTPGWATITVAIFFLGGIQILSIGVLGEYLGRIFSEVKSRPGHIISNEFSYLDHRTDSDSTAP